MKRKALLPLGLLAPGILAACVAASRAQQVYFTGMYSAGTTYYNVCSTSLPFVPGQFNLTELSWREDKEGSYIADDVERKAAPGDISRRCLEVDNGTNGYFLPMDSYPDSYRTKQFKCGDDPPIVKGSGDFTSVMTHSLASRGGHSTINALPVFKTNWICGSRTNEDIFILDGDHYAQIQNLLERAYGKPDGAIHSSASAGGDCCSINYTPTQIGVFLNLTRTFDDNTIVSIIGTPKP